MNRRERRAMARRLTAGRGLKGTEKSELRREISTSILARGEDPAPVLKAPRSRLWTPPRDLSDRIAGLVVPR